MTLFSDNRSVWRVRQRIALVNVFCKCIVVAFTRVSSRSAWVKRVVVSGVQPLQNILFARILVRIFETLAATIRALL
jgi:hypothetical protein